MPNFVTIARAIRLTCWMSLAAPEVTFSGPKTSSSATLPPIAIAIIDLYLAIVTESWSRSGSDSTRPSARPRGMIVALWIGSCCGTFSPTTACPDSW